MENVAGGSNRSDMEGIYSLLLASSIRFAPSMHGADPPESYFDVAFVEVTPSRYAPTSVFHAGLNQVSLLSTSRHCDIDLNHEVEESLCEKQDYRLFLDNPLKMGLFLDTIGNGDVRRM